MKFNYSLGRKAKSFLSPELSYSDIISSERSQVFSLCSGFCQWPRCGEPPAGALSPVVWPF